VAAIFGSDGRPRRVAAFNEGWAWATAEKGAAYVAAVTQKIAGFLVDLATLEPGKLHV
jgi:hypothetical protein